MHCDIPRYFSPFCPIPPSPSHITNAEYYTKVDYFSVFLFAEGIQFEVGGPRWTRVEGLAARHPVFHTLKAMAGKEWDDSTD